MPNIFLILFPKTCNLWSSLKVRNHFSHTCKKLAEYFVYPDLWHSGKQRGCQVLKLNNDRHFCNLFVSCFHHESCFYSLVMFPETYIYFETFSHYVWLYGGCSNGVPMIHFFQAEHTIQFRSLGFSNHEKVTLRQEISKWSTVCSMFLRSGRSTVRSAPLAKGGTLKNRPSQHLQKVLTWSNKVSPQTLRTALILSVCLLFQWMDRYMLLLLKLIKHTHFFVP
jgi:hypothetical protein